MFGSKKNPKDTLDREIGKYIKEGYRIQQQSGGSVELIKPKRYRPIRDTLGLGLLSYAHRKEDQVYLHVDEKGKIHDDKGKA